MEREEEEVGALPAKMQPMDQMSIEVEYLLEPMSTSGALYQRVTTSFE